MKFDIHKAFDAVNWLLEGFAGSGLWTMLAGVGVHLILHDHFQRGWPHQEHCILCNGPLETRLRLSLLCSFTKIVWSQILSREQFDVQLMQPSQDHPHLKNWWEEAAAKMSKEEKWRFNGMLIYKLWNLWKERTRRIFQSVQEPDSRSPLELKRILYIKRGLWHGGGSS